jgi:hypothetical protein
MVVLASSRAKVEMTIWLIEMGCSVLPDLFKTEESITGRRKVGK